MKKKSRQPWSWARDNTFVIDDKQWGEENGVGWAVGPEQPATCTRLNQIPFQNEITHVDGFGTRLQHYYNVYRWEWRRSYIYGNFSRLPSCHIRYVLITCTYFSPTMVSVLSVSPPGGRHSLLHIMHSKACVIIVRGLNLKTFKSGTTFFIFEGL